MKRFFAYKNNISNEYIIITNDEFSHLNKVLRLTVSEKIICITGDEFDYFCQLEKIEKNQAIAKIIERKLNESNPKIIIDVFQGLPKGEKSELIVQKLSELGANNLIFFESEFTVAKLKHNSKIERLSKIAHQACKQCGRSKPLNLKDPIKFDAIKNLMDNYDIVLFFNENAGEECEPKNLTDTIKKSKRIALIIGAEGGFSEKEIKFLNEMKLKNFFNVSLGKRILRTETASISAVAHISFLTGNWIKTKNFKKN